MLDQKTTLRHYHTIAKEQSGEFLERLDPDLLGKKVFLENDIRGLFKFLIKNKQDHIFDLGCGTGWYYPVLKDFSHKITGIDISPALLQLARQQNLSGVSLLLYNGGTLPFDDDCIDFMMEWDALHHLEHPAAMLREIVRVLSPRGIFIGIEPNVFNPLVGLYHFKRPHERGCFRTNRITMGKRLATLFHDFKIYSNNLAISYNNIFFQKIIHWIDPFFIYPAGLKMLSLRYVFMAWNPK